MAVKATSNIENVKNQIATKVQGQESIGDSKPKTVIDLIADNKSSIAEMLPKHISPDKFIRTIISAIRTNDKLRICTPVSILDGVRKAAQLGLDINTPLQQAYLIPFKEKKNINGQWTEYYEAEFQYGYRGIIQLVWQSGLVKTLDFDVICEGDEIIYEKTQDGVKFSHKPVIKGKRGEPYAYYATAMTKDGGFSVVVMSKEDIMEHAKKFTKSKDKNGNLIGTWVDNFDGMALKTVIKVLADKKLPKSADREAIALQMELAKEDEKTRTNQDPSEVDYVTPGEYEVTDNEDIPSRENERLQENIENGTKQNEKNIKCFLEGQQSLV